MVWLLRKCEKCGQYTLRKETCPYCGGKLRLAHPPKFSPDDKYLKYRMALKMDGSQQ
ncbi:MAG: RNA-protein complex protein Nop10 [Candidatus Bathyarchaeota archaeon]|jgi:H/ACA ribonucleoprotein complex subunit 3|nr:RNA-protein complex protein Nop10 [Candidatus Bathyarchaeota archaeon]